jgi:multidrug efflux pump subunit AcrB
VLSSVFIHRPRLALVISLVISLAGIIALESLPVAQFPDIVPPQVLVNMSNLSQSRSYTNVLWGWLNASSTA